MKVPSSFFLFAMVTLALTIDDKDFGKSQGELTVGDKNEINTVTIFDQVIDVEKRGKHKTKTYKDKKKYKDLKDEINEDGTTTITHTNGKAYKMEWHPITSTKKEKGENKGLARYFGSFRTKHIALD